MIVYMSFVKDECFLGACIVHADDQEDALRVAWRKNCNPGGEVMSVIVRHNLPDEKWFDRLLAKTDLAEMECELNAKYCPDDPKRTPGLYQ